MSVVTKREVIDYFLDLGISGFQYQIESDQKVFCPKCSKLRKHSSDRPLSINLVKGIYNCHTADGAAV